MTERTFHFTLGPVQGFVAQARRTRDFWAGSFLLSWLAGAAMQTVIAQGGKIVFPTPDGDYLNWLSGRGQGPRPRQGGIPNRFKATVSDDFQLPLVEQAVRTAWRALAEVIWQNDLQWHCQRYPDSRAIWDRQIHGFWEIAWVIGDDDSLLDQRKNWRTQLPPAEAGIKCSIMAGWQELSGLPAPDKKRLADFWQPIRQQCGRDLSDDETLCAIAFVKRRFPHYFDQIKAPMPGDWTLHGWKVNPQTPSTLDLAAANWLARVVDKGSKVEVAHLHEAAERLPFAPGDCGVNRLRCVKEAYKTQEVRHLNSSVLFSHVLDNRNECPDPAAVREMKKAIKALKLNDFPAPFYAILRMDGDSLGALLRCRDNQQKIPKSLKKFTCTVPNIVYENNGFLIYAGGDDVLALLPLEDALQCAADIRQCYLNAFATQNLESTISAAVEYAHVKTPLTRILADSHHLLDDIAKEQCGRDALAVRVWKPGGQALEWARPWEKALTEDGGLLKITQIADQFSGDKPEFSSKFFYRIREHFDLLNPAKDRKEERGNESAIFSEDDAIALLAVDYLASGINEGRKKLKIKDAKDIVQPLLEQCRPVIRYVDGKSMALRPKEKLEANGILFREQDRLEVDGALLVRFLARKGVER